MSEQMARLWKLADRIGVAKMRTELVRNPDRAIRDQFAIDAQIEGTKAWAINQCMAMANPSCTYSDEQCAQITSALGV